MFKYFLYPLVMIDIHDLAFSRTLRVYFVLIGVWRDEKTLSVDFSQVSLTIGLSRFVSHIPDSLFLYLTLQITPQRCR